MAYIEIVGIACSGKTYFKNKISKKYKKIMKRKLLLMIILITINKFLWKLKCNLLLYSYNNKIRYIKSIFKRCYLHR